MTELKDRVPGQPNRKKIIQENGNTYYATIEYADNPLIEGTTVNKKNVLDTIYPESTNSAVGTISLKIQNTHDSRWRKCGQAVSANEAPAFFQDTKALLQPDFRRTLSPNMTSLTKIYCYDGILYGFDGSTRIYVSNDWGETWIDKMSSVGITGGSGVVTAFKKLANGKFFLVSTYGTSGKYSFGIIDFDTLTAVGTYTGDAYSTPSGSIATNNNIVIVTTSGGSYSDYLRSTDYGVTWTRISRNAAMEAACSVEYINGMFWGIRHVGSRPYYAKFAYSVDGLSWSVLGYVDENNEDYNWGSSYYSYCGNSSALYLVGNGKIYRSTDNFSSFDIYSSKNIPKSVCEGILIENNIYICSYQGYIVGFDVSNNGISCLNVDGTMPTGSSYTTFDEDSGKMVTVDSPFYLFNVNEVMLPELENGYVKIL